MYASRMYAKRETSRSCSPRLGRRVSLCAGRLRLGLTLALLALGLIVALPLSAAELRVAVAANFLKPLQTLAERYRAQHGVKVRISSGASGALYARIVNGAPFDLLLSADAERPQRLLAEQRALAGSCRTYAVGKLVLWSPDPGLSGSIEPLLHQGDGFRHLALAEPRTAPYGRAAREVLEHLELWQALQQQERLVRGQSIGQAHQQVASGAARLGFVARAQVQGADGTVRGAFWQPPADSHAPIRQQAVVLSNGREQQAQAFLDWLCGSEAQQLIESLGYQTGDCRC